MQKKTLEKKCSIHSAIQTKYPTSDHVITIQSPQMINSTETDLQRSTHGELVYLESGVVIALLENRFFIIYTGSYIWIPPNTEYKLTSNRPSTIHYLHVYQSVLSSLPASPSIFEASPLFLQLLGKLHRIKDQYNTSQSMVNSLTSLLIMEIVEGRKLDTSLPLPKDKRLLKLCNRLLREPLHSKTISDLLEEAPLSYRHAIRLFKKQTGIDFGRWRILLKLHTSISLLISGHSITQVSNKIGYSNPSGFSIAFKNYFGVSPRKFISQNNSLMEREYTEFLSQKYSREAV